MNMACVKLGFTVKEKSTVNFIVCDNQTKVDFSIRETITLIEGEKYDGEYFVIPKAFESTTLMTKNKVMENDVFVDEIPYDETSNEFGKTVVIAS